MLTTLSILSLDQGKIWKDPCPLLRDEAPTFREEAPQPVKSRRFPSACLGLVACLLAAHK